MGTPRARRHTRKEQMQLITECRQSGLSDAEWCRQNGICVSTFYGWLQRLRNEACEIPEPSYGHTLTVSEKQDVVKIDILPEYPEPAVHPVREEKAGLHFDNSHTIEIEISDITIRVTNDADPLLLAQMINALKGGGYAG